MLLTAIVFSVIFAVLIIVVCSATNDDISEEIDLNADYKWFYHVKTYGGDDYGFFGDRYYSTFELYEYFKNNEYLTVSDIVVLDIFPPTHYSIYFPLTIRTADICSIKSTQREFHEAHRDILFFIE